MNNSYNGPDQYIPSQGGSHSPGIPPEPWSPVSGRLVRWIAVLSTVALVLVPVIYRAAPKEIARWHIAAAHEQYLDGKEAEAAGSLARALEWDANSLEAYLLEAQIHESRKEYEAALKACERASELSPHSERVRRIRNQLWLQLERYDDVIQDCEKQLKSLELASKLLRVEPLNELAYARALADKDLEKGVQEINTALESDSNNLSMLDTRGFLLYRLGKYKEALVDLDSSVEQTERELKQIEKLEVAQLKSLDAREFKPKLKQFKRNAAVIFYHRGLILEKLKEKEKAEEDFRKVRELGFEPSRELF